MLGSDSMTIWECLFIAMMKHQQEGRSQLSAGTAPSLKVQIQPGKGFLSEWEPRYLLNSHWKSQNESENLQVWQPQEFMSDNRWNNQKDKIFRRFCTWTKKFSLSYNSKLCYKSKLIVVWAYAFTMWSFWDK